MRRRNVVGGAAAGQRFSALQLLVVEASLAVVPRAVNALWVLTRLPFGSAMLQLAPVTLVLPVTATV
jgi:hypothetical protein